MKSIHLTVFRLILAAMIVCILFSCNRNLSPTQAAGGGHRKARSVN